MFRRQRRHLRLWTVLAEKCKFAGDAGNIEQKALQDAITRLHMRSGGRDESYACCFILANAKWPTHCCSFAASLFLAQQRIKTGESPPQTSAVQGAPVDFEEVGALRRAPESPLSGPAKAGHVRDSSFKPSRTPSRSKMSPAAHACTTLAVLMTTNTTWSTPLMLLAKTLSLLTYLVF